MIEELRAARNAIASNAARSRPDGSNLLRTPTLVPLNVLDPRAERCCRIFCQVRHGGTSPRAWRWCAEPGRRHSPITDRSEWMRAFWSIMTDRPAEACLPDCAAR